MYQVLQVYRRFSFFDNFISRSIKVGQSSSRRRRLRVAETSSRRRGDVVATFPQSFGLLENIFSHCDVVATSPRPTGDLKKSRPTETRVANRSPTSLHASEIGLKRNSVVTVLAHSGI